MFVLNTIKLEKKSNPVVLSTTRSIRVISAIGAISSYGFLMLALNSLAPSRYLIAFGMYFFIFIGLWFCLFRKVVVVSRKAQSLKISYMLFGAVFKEAILPFNEITSLHAENRSHGQTIQKKLRLFAASDTKKLDLGVVNHEKKSEEIIALIKAELGQLKAVEK